MAETTGSANGQGESARHRIIGALLTLLAEKSLEQISLGDIARRAGVTLAELRDGTFIK
jgi:AcrR family transcriptional regulator